MRTKLLLATVIAILASINLFAQNVIKVERGPITLSYDTAIGRTMWAHYYVDNTNQKSDYRLQRVFHDPIDKRIYYPPGYDRGHLVPDRDMEYNRRANEAASLSINMVPMVRDLNRGHWLKLENRVRAIAKSGNRLSVFTGATYDQYSAIPTRVYKIIMWFSGPMEARMFNIEAYIANNCARCNESGVELIDTKVIKDVTGFEFFYHVSRVRMN